MNRRELIAALGINGEVLEKLLAEGLPSRDEIAMNFDYDEVMKWRKEYVRLGIDQLLVGATYSNHEVVNAFKCSPQGGMRRSRMKNALVLISDHTGKALYEDRWIGDELHYTGMGQEGDQQLDKSQNKTLATSNETDIRVFLFEVYKEKHYVYAGEVTLAGEPYVKLEADAKGNMRKVYKFPLLLKDKFYAIPEDDWKRATIVREKVVKRLDSTNLEQKAKALSERNKQDQLDDKRDAYRLVRKREFFRDPLIAEYVKDIAQGVCQLCEKKCSF